LENFCKVKQKGGGLVPFKLNEMQKDLFNTLNKNNRVMSLKARQLEAVPAWLDIFMSIPL